MEFIQHLSAAAKGLPTLHLPVSVILALVMVLAVRFLRQPGFLAAGFGFAINAIQLILEQLAGWLPNWQTGTALTIYPHSAWFNGLIIGLDLLASFCFLEAALNSSTIKDLHFDWPRATWRASFNLNHIFTACLAIPFTILAVQRAGILDHPRPLLRVLALAPNVLLALLALLLLARTIEKLEVTKYQARLKHAAVLLRLYALIQPLYLLRAAAEPGPFDLETLTGSARALLGFHYSGYLLGFLFKVLFTVNFVSVLLDTMKEYIAESDDYKRTRAMKRVVLAVAHNFRQPIGLIAPTLDQLEKKLSDGEGKKLLSRIRHQIVQMDSLVERFLLLRRGEEAGREWVQASKIARVAAERLQIRRKRDIAEDTKIEVSVYISEKLLVRVNDELVDSAIDAILDNAVDEIRVRGSQEIKLMTKAKHDQSEVWIDIWNSGKPIPEEERDKIFDVFYTTKDSGTGLGLFVSRSYIELLGGSLNYIQTKDHGGLFRITLTRARRVKSVAAIKHRTALDDGWF